MVRTNDVYEAAAFAIAVSSSGEWSEQKDLAVWIYPDITIHELGKINGVISAHEVDY